MSFCRQELLIQFCQNPVKLPVFLIYVWCYVIIPVYILILHRYSFFRFTASAQNLPCASTEGKRVFLFAFRSTRSKRTRVESTQNISTQPPARSKSLRWEGWEKKVLETFVLIVPGDGDVPPEWPLHDLFQPKGADRKQKTDREKMEKRAPQEKEKYQPSYETTILTEVSMLLKL